MPTLFETVQELRAVDSLIKPKSEKSRVDLSLSASASSRASVTFKLVKVDLSKIPMLSAGNDEGPVIIDVNSDRLRKTKAGYIPKLIVLRGLDTLRAAKRNGELSCSAWVGDKVKVDILDPNGTISAADTSVMESLLDKPNNGVGALGFRPVSTATTQLQTPGGMFMNFGAPGSEANNPILKLMLNVEEALTMYETEKADGVHKVVFVPFAAVPPGLINASREAKIAAESVGIDIEKFSVMDFLKWQNNKMNMKASAKTKNGLPISAFAFVGDMSDPSTWLLQIDSAASAKESLAKVKYTRAVPKSEKKQVTAKIKSKIEADMVEPFPSVSTETTGS